MRKSTFSSGGGGGVLFLCDPQAELLMERRMTEDEGGGPPFAEDGRGVRRRRMEKEANPSLKKTKQEKCQSFFRDESSREMDLPRSYVGCERN
jgi:hypothetical protein